MTRINCIPPSELTDQHLGAEYRELPRVFTLAFNAYIRGDDPSTFPQTYTMGAGHVKFFYPRLAYIERRYADIVIECLNRGRQVNYPQTPSLPPMPASWWNDWTPTQAAMTLNRYRIAARLQAVTV